MKLIGFSGAMGSGKSTAISSLEDIQHRRVVNMKFAQPLYDLQEFAYRRISPVYQKPSNFIKDRKLLQFLGTEWGRDSIYTNLWVDLWKHEVKYLLENEPKAIIVCDDVRFDNEAVAIKELGGHIIQLICSRNNERINTTNGIPLHKSELGIDLKYVDYVIDNNGTVDDLKTSLLTFNTKAALW